MEGWGCVFVEGGALAAGFVSAGVAVVELGRHRRVVGYSEAIDVEKTVARSNFVFRCEGVWVVGEEFREVVLVDLFGEGVGLGEEVSGRFWMVCSAECDLLAR